MPATKPNNPPISLSDHQLSMVMTAAAPLDPHRRSAFLVALATMLRSEPQPIGDGSLGRCIRRLQPEFHDPLSIASNSRPLVRGRSKLVDAPPIGIAPRW
jgi:hypothetical protein